MRFTRQFIHGMGHAGPGSTYPKTERETAVSFVERRAAPRGATWSPVQLLSRHTSEQVILQQQDRYS